MPVTSLLDTDLYKFTMGNFAQKFLPDTVVRYSLVQRDRRTFPEDFERHLRGAVENLGGLSLDHGELSYLRSACLWIDDGFAARLRALRLDPSVVRIVQEGGELRVTIEGPWVDTIYWEVPLLATISELYFVRQGVQVPLEAAACTEIPRRKAEVFRRHGIRFADFGTRRRFSAIHHERVLAALAESAADCLAGTSNLRLARRFGLPPSGTQAHEMYSLLGALHGEERANAVALARWIELYPDHPGIALADTFGSTAFFLAFDRATAGRFAGVRQDSGDPLDFLERAIAGYEALGLDPHTKTVVFSDALDTEKVLRIEHARRGRIGALYGIGTFLTNDIPGVRPLNLVLKLTAVQTPQGWRPAVKLTDDPAKASGDADALHACRRRLAEWMSRQPDPWMDKKEARLDWPTGRSC